MDEFFPGERISIPGSLQSPRSPLPACRKFLRVAVPQRIGLSVKDMRTFAPGKPGGGGIGFSVNLPTSSCVYVDTTVATSESVVSCHRKRLLVHHIAVFRSLLRTNGLKSDFFIAVVGNAEAELVHCGLGSTSSLVLGLYFGINEAIGAPFSREELRILLAFNYVEEGAGTETVVFGYETTMTGTGAVAGGMYIIDEHSLEVTARNTQVFGQKPVYIFLPDQRACLSAEKEAELLTECSHEDGALSKDSIFSFLTTELTRGYDCDLRTVGNLVWQLQTLGSKRVEVLKQPSGSRVLSFMESVRSVPSVLVTGMSSIGPAAVALCEELEPEVERIAERCGLKTLAVTTVSESGAVVREEPIPELVCVLGAPCAGKSTWCERNKSPSAAHFSGGQFVREYVNSHSDSTASAMRRIMEAGEVRDVDDVTTKAALPEVYRLAASSPCVLLDGIPRSESQMRTWLERFAAPIRRLVAVCAPLETRKARFAARHREGDVDFHTRDAHDETDAVVALCRTLGMDVQLISNP